MPSPVAPVPQGSSRNGRSSSTRQLKPVAKPPFIKVTRYEQVTSGLISGVGLLGSTLMILIVVWLANRLPTVVLKEPMMAAGDGGWEDGTLDATPDVDSPEDPTEDPSVSNEQTDVTELMEITDPVMEASESAAQLVEPTAFQDPNNSGNPGSAEGTGGRPLGSGGPGRGGAKRDQRWFVAFADKGNLKSYASQLDFFKIELGVMFPAESRLIYMSNMSADRPTTREVRTGDNEKRLFMNWEGGDRKEADAELFDKAGINARTGVILHFYPDPLELTMAQMELSYANRKTEQIRRTYFQVEREGNGFKFVVTDQKLR